MYILRLHCRKHSCIFKTVLSYRVFPISIVLYVQYTVSLLNNYVFWLKYLYCIHRVLFVWLITPPYEQQRRHIEFSLPLWQKKPNSIVLRHIWVSHIIHHSDHTYIYIYHYSELIVYDPCYTRWMKVPYRCTYNELGWLHEYSARLPFWKVGESKGHRFISGPHNFLTLVKSNQWL